LVLRKAVFEEVGGLNAHDLPVSYNDVDLCLKIQAAGYRNIWIPFAHLYHHEALSRGFDFESEKIARANREVDYMRRKWGEGFANDPYYNPNLSLENAAFSLAFPFSTGEAVAGEGFWELLIPSHHKQECNSASRWST